MSPSEQPAKHCAGASLVLQGGEEVLAIWGDAPLGAEPAAAAGDRCWGAQVCAANQVGNVQYRLFGLMVREWPLPGGIR